MTKDKNEQKPSKARRESLSLNLDSGELDLDSTAGSVQDEVKKPKRGRPRKVKTDAEGEKPTKKASRKSAVKSDDFPLSLFGKNDKAGETLDFMIGSLPEEKPSRGRRKKVAPKTKSTAAQPEQTKTVLDPVSSIVSQLDRRVSGETEKPKSASAPAVEVPDLNAPDFSLDDFFASDEQLDIAWGKKADDLESQAEVEVANEKTPAETDQPALPVADASEPEEDFFGFVPKEETSEAPREEHREERAPRDRNSEYNKDRNRDRNRDRDPDKDRDRNRDRDRDKDRNRDRDSRRERSSEPEVQEKPVDRPNSNDSSRRDRGDRRDRRDRDRRRDHRDNRNNNDNRDNNRDNIDNDRVVPARDDVSADTNEIRFTVPDSEIHFDLPTPEAKQEFRAPVPDTPFAGIFDDEPLDQAPATQAPVTQAPVKQSPAKQAPQQEPRQPVPNTPFAGIFDDDSVDFDAVPSFKNEKKPAEQVSSSSRQELPAQQNRPERDNRNREERDNRTRPERDNRGREDRNNRGQESRENRGREDRNNRGQESRENRGREDRNNRGQESRDDRGRQEQDTRPREERRNAPAQEEARQVAPTSEKQADRKPERPQFSSWNETIETVVRFNIEKHAAKKNNPGSGNNNRRK